MSEFDIIRKFFTNLGAPRSDVILGVGDDCALLDITARQCLAVSIDTLSAGVHFLPDCQPESIGHKALAVGLSDLAAMGAEPTWATLAITLPAIDEDWLARFCAGFAALAECYQVRLIGGDTTRGPLSITVQVHGYLPSAKQAITRYGAQPGDLLCVSGTLGDAGLALKKILTKESVTFNLRQRLEFPTPRVELGVNLRGLATAAIDLSDGLAGDLEHLVTASKVGAKIQLDALPLASEVSEYVRDYNDWKLPLTAGDDYELCFTLPAVRLKQLFEISAKIRCQVQVIGCIDDHAGVKFFYADGNEYVPTSIGYDHFKKNSY